MFRRVACRWAAAQAGSKGGEGSDKKGPAIEVGAKIGDYGPFQLYYSAPEDGVIHVVVNGKSKLNLLDSQYIDGLAAAMSTLSELEDTARVAVMYTLREKHFCAGLDLKKAGSEIFGEVSNYEKAKAATAAMMGSRPQLTEPGQPAMRAQKLHRTIKKWQDGISGITRCRIPILAAVHGHCIGGGLNIAAAADMRYCTPDAVFSLREARVGITADIGALQRLPGIVGEGVTRELAYTARDFNGDEAARLRLVNLVLPTYDHLIRHTFNTAVEIANNSPIAVQGCKEVLNFQSEKAAQESLDHVRLWNSAFIKSNDLVEASVAFAQKRKPRFVDKTVDARSTKPAGGGAAAKKKKTDDADADK